MKDSAQLWGGRFASGPAAVTEALSRSVQFDWRLAPYDLAGSRAHARVLNRAGILTDEETQKILIALEELDIECAKETFEFLPQDEDVHSALERGLIEKLGPLGGKLRAGRSRNDQVATDHRLYLIDHAEKIAFAVKELCGVLVTQAETHLGVVMPGMTHLQHAQPVLLSHHLLAHVNPLLRDLDRLNDWEKRSSVCPLGAGALAGSSLQLDPERVASELGFARAHENSIDAVSDRDFAAEFLFVAALLGVHISRLAEEIVLWSSSEFRWITLDDAFSTGSSIMPQKKNPDVAELARAKTGRLVGNLTTLLVALKGLPLSLNRDMQEDKESVFDSVDTLMLVLPAFTGMIATMTVNVDAMRAAAPQGFTLATDVAEWLVQRGVPFREAHEITGAMVALAESRGCQLEDLSGADLAAVSPYLTSDVRAVLTVENAIAARTASGSTGLEPVKVQLGHIKLRLAELVE